MLLPIVDLSVESTPAGFNDPVLAERVRAALVREIGEDVLFELERDSMGAEDFAEFVMTKEKVPGAYFSVGGSSQEVIDAAAAGGPRPPLIIRPPFGSIPGPRSWAVCTG